MISTSFHSLKNKIKARWGKFTDSEVEDCCKNIDEIVPRIEKSYGVARERAEQEFREFQKTLDEIHPKQDNAAVQNPPPK
jgi:hypothetical protein